MSGTSKFLSYVLRHRPDAIGITLDTGGWVAVDELLRACAAHGHTLTREMLHAIVEEKTKKRFALSDDGTLIRASQGHSVDVDLGYEPEEPPEILYHGTAERFLPSIMEEGVQRRSRHHVHLSADVETARTVGGRHGRAVVLRVRSGEMWRAGVPFHRSANGVWLVDAVPAEYLSIDE